MAFLTMSILFAVSTFLYGVYKYLTKDFDYWRKRNTEYIKPVPIFGNFMDVATLKRGLGFRLADLYRAATGDFFGAWIFSTPYLVVRSPELVKRILVKDFDHFYNRSVACFKTADPIASQMMFFTKYPEWKPLRSKTSPIFTTGKIKSMLPLMNIAAEELKMYLSQRSFKVLEMKEISAKFSVDVITSCAFGLNANSFSNENAEFRDVARKMFAYNVPNSIKCTSYFCAHFLVKMFNFTFFDASIYAFCREAFWTTIRQRESSKMKRNDLIDTIIQMMKEPWLDDQEFEGDLVVAQAVQFFAAGFETISSTMAFALYELCLNEEVQAKLRKEFKECNERYGDFTYEFVQDMKYLDKVVKETLRKYPPVPFLDRVCMKDYKVLDSNLVLEKGRAVYIPLLGLHYDPMYFPDPERFDPERFSEENIASRPSYAFLPFGQGPHSCIGERFGLIVTKLGIMHIISQFEVLRCKETQVPLEYDHKSVLIKAVNGLHMTISDLKQRHSATA